MKFISLFSGVGGFDLGFERAGMECVAQVEKDPYCLRVLAKHWPNVERFEDVREFGKHNAPAAELICGGFPCQPHSVAGKRKGESDDRDLWPEYRRIIRELNPAWVVGENVPGIRTTILDQVLSDLENLDYATITFVIPACAVDAPHRRDRVWIVAHATGSNAGQQAKRQRWEDFNGGSFNSGGDAGKGSTPIPHTNGAGLAQRKSQRSHSCQEQSTVIGTNWWSTEPAVGRVAHGVPNRVDRLRSLGNAVVPQVAAWIGHRIMQVESELHQKRN